LVSKSENLPVIYQALKQIGAAQVRTLEMAQGQKISRIVAWRFE
jgi:23S rRNA (adenine1618-N6)-methyltransferase